MTPRDRQRICRSATVGSASMFGVAAVAPFIRPGGWAIWPALALLLTAIVAMVRVAAVVRQREPE